MSKLRECEYLPHKTGALVTSTAMLSPESDASEHFLHFLYLLSMAAGHSWNTKQGKEKRSKIKV